MSNVFNLIFDLPESQRLDKYLVDQFPDFSRSRLQSFIRGGMVSVDGKQVLKGGMNLEKGSEISISIPPVVKSDLIPEQIPLDIIFENADLMIVNKPAGMVVHPASGHLSGTLVHAAINYVPDMEGVGGEHRPGVVHRLDKDTSGLIILAKNDNAHRFLQDQFRKRSIHKTYYALTDGFPPTPTGRVEAPIGRDPSHRKQMAIVPISRGRESVTEYKVIEKFEQHALIAAYPHTGRTHQIRLHLAFLGCPIVGDRVYGHRKQFLDADRQMLHAAQIEFILPGESSPKIFQAPIPDDMNQLLIELRHH
jgi:23S rRNA pseudouridine1911/1915/1917 synthase